MMPDIPDITALALLAGVLLMGERWASKLVDALTKHLDRQADTFDKMSAILLTIQESLQKLDKD